MESGYEIIEAFQGSKGICRGVSALECGVPGVEGTSL